MRLRRALVAVASVATLAAGCGSGGGGAQVSAEATHKWQQLDDWPLSTRNSVVAVWTGEEILAIGGSTFSCPPNASCAVRDDEPRFQDGAALDPSTGHWHVIADAPVPVLSASSAVIDGNVYLLAQTDFAGASAFLRYSIADDAWSQLEQPATRAAYYRLAVAGDSLVAIASTHEHGAADDLQFDPSDGTWSPLPASPLGDGFDRGAVWVAPHLYLFDHELVPQPNVERPSVVRAARLDLEAQTWERLPDSAMLGWDPSWWLVDGDRIIDPALGCADGGDVNRWGRGYPYGGMFDITTRTWSDLPSTGEPCDPVKPEPVAGALGRTSALYVAPRGRLFDAASDTWRTLPAIPGEDDSNRTIVTAGRAAVVLGRSTWIWRP